MSGLRGGPYDDIFGLVLTRLLLSSRGPLLTTLKNICDQCTHDGGLMEVVFK